ncbi:transcriptional regulator [Streptomyces sp. NBC_00859]|uniref:transcriptional regulator n=1 Tax=Streptomyces sp. NBC_00859 TaxID=2903682 RepID=UPI00386C3417|nr:transcriptional regulator [Streptomyces sp. NBC_00859]
MDRTAHDVLRTTTAELAPGAAENGLVPLLASGAADRGAVAALALEQQHVIASDRSAFTHLAGRSAARGDDACAVFFAALARGEDTAAERLEALITGCGLDRADAAAYEPTAGCQAYPSYVARLALTAAPAEAALALIVNFAAWGGYCATIAEGLRTHYGFDDAACGFFDFFAEPAPVLEAQGTAAVQAGLDGGLDLTAARRHGRLLQSYELMFWNTLAGQA